MKKIIYIIVFLIGVKSFTQSMLSQLDRLRQQQLSVQQDVFGTPQLTSFRIDDSNKNRVYFNSSEPISGSDFNGFVISGKTVSSIHVSANKTTGHYLTVSSPFTFWDNNTIRYDGGGDIKDSELNKLMSFRMKYISNNITEPLASNYIYVSTSGNDSNNGSLNSPFKTITKAISVASPGTTIWVKAGNYGTETVSINKSGTSTAPIKLIGYKNSIGDITSNYYNYGQTQTLATTPQLNTNEMPTLIGVDNSNNTAITAPASEYIIIKNFQARNHRSLFYSNLNKNLLIKNCIAKDAGSNSVNGRAFAFSTNSERIRIIDCIAINSTMHNILLNGSFGLIKGCKSYGNDTRSAAWSTDYYFALAGSNNIMIDNFSLRDGNLPHTGHGLSIDTSGGTYTTQYNLVENYIAPNQGKSVEFRGGTVAFNIVRNHTSYKVTDNNSNGIMFRDGSHDNVVENSLLYSLNTAFPYAGTNETSSGISYRNTVYNTLVFNSGKVTYPTVTLDTPEIIDTKFVNCTFDNITSVFFNVDNTTTFSNNEFINCSISNSPNLGQSNIFSFKYCNFYNSFTTPSGIGNISVNPNFVSDYEPTNISMKAGIYSEDAILDINNIHRQNPPTIGAKELITENGHTPPPTIVDLYPQDNAASVQNEVNGMGVLSNHGVTSQIISSDKHHGSYSIKLTATDKDYGRVEIPVNVENNKSYTVEVWSKAGQGTRQRAVLWSGFSQSPNQFILSKTWVKTTFTVTANITGIAKVKFYAASYGGAVGDELIIDEIKITEN